MRKLPLINMPYDYSISSIMDRPAKLLFLSGLLAICSGCALKDNSHSSSPYADRKGDSGRNMYSPEIYEDAQAQQQWMTGIEALERQCRTTGDYCQEAQGARRSLNRHLTGASRPAR
jgi:hypothetical protein